MAKEQLKASESTTQKANHMLLSGRETRSYWLVIRSMCKAFPNILEIYLTRTNTSVRSKFVQVTAVLCLDNWHSLPQ